MNRINQKSVKDLFRVFVFLNKYSWPTVRHETLFLLTVDLFESTTGVKAGRITNLLKRGDKITQSDKNKTWTAGINLIEKGLLFSPRVGYYKATPKGWLHTSELLKDLRLHDREFDLGNLMVPK